MPILLKILLSLGLIMLVQHLRRNLLLAVLASTILLGFWAGHTVHSFSAVVVESFFSKTSFNNYMLLLMILLVIWFSSQLSMTGVMNDLTRSVSGIFQKRTAMAVLPALIGLLPMPGGALFSAPLVDDCDTRKEIPPLLKTKINFWFRHIWEYWWPLYPGVILAIDITGLEPALFMAALFPMTLLSIIIGYVFYLRKIPISKRTTRGRYRDVLIPLLPVGILLIVYVIIQCAFPFIGAASRYLPMGIGVLFAMISQQILRPLPVRKWLVIISSRKAFFMLGLVAAVRIYGAFIKAELPNGEFIISQLRMEMAGAGIPPLLLIVLLPFVASLTSGIAVGFVGASLPIVMQLAGNDLPTSQVVATAVLAYGGGYVALILSPIHVCLVVTNEHFGTGLLASIRKMLLPASVLFAGICLWAFFIWNVF